MISDIVSSVRTNFQGRLSSPLFGAFVASWIFWNYKIVLVVFSSMNVLEKISYIENQIDDGLIIFFLNKLVFPLLIAVGLLYGYPYPAKKVFEFTRRKQNELNDLKKKIDDEAIISRKDHFRVKENMYREIKRIKDDNDRLEEEIDHMRNGYQQKEDENIELQRKLDKAKAIIESGEKEPVSNELIEEALFKQSYILNYNYNDTGWKSKTLSFDIGGEILNGKNNSEYSWQISNGYLELIRKDGSTHSRFSYHPISEIFIHTNDEDTLSSKGQYLVPHREFNN